MKYDFEHAPSRRNTGSYKWEIMLSENPELPADVLPYSIADMEFITAPEIRDGLCEYIQKNVLGYTFATDDYYGSVSRWMLRRHGFPVSKEQVLLCDGVVPALDAAVRIFTKPDEAVLVPTPVYYPFFSAVEKSRRTLVTCDLIEKDGIYFFDFECFEALASREDVTLCILSNPHNPIGKIYTKEELVRIATICHDHGVYLICDEIHNDLILPGYQFVSSGTLPDDLKKNIMLCTAPSKTFNLAGLACSNLIFFDPDRKDLYQQEGGSHNVNVLGLIACRTAYDTAEPWLDALRNVLGENCKTVEAYLEKELPMLHASPLMGTYLMWIDFRKLGMDAGSLKKFLREKAFLFSDEGDMFGKAGEGFVRINIACPKAALLSMLCRLKEAIQSL
jgi:putative C-S lyase